MKIVFFTNKSARGAEILEQIRHKNIPLEAIFIDIHQPKTKSLLKKANRIQKRIGLNETLKLILKRVRRRYIKRTRREWHSNEFYHAYANKVHLVENFNGKKCELLLQAIEPDLIILGGAGIIRQNIISIPKIGVLNAHPGLLPRYRGVDVIPWAIYHGDPVGVTIHFIDSGIDTGGILTQKEIELIEGDTIGRLMTKANMVAGELMSEVVLLLTEEGQIRETPQEEVDGKQYYRMPIKLRLETEKKLQTILNVSRQKRKVQYVD